MKITIDFFLKYIGKLGNVYIKAVITKQILATLKWILTVYVFICMIKNCYQSYPLILS